MPDEYTVCQCSYRCLTCFYLLNITLICDIIQADTVSCDKYRVDVFKRDGGKEQEYMICISDITEG